MKTDGDLELVPRSELVRAESTIQKLTEELQGYKKAIRASEEELESQTVENERLDDTIAELQKERDALADSVDAVQKLLWQTVEERNALRAALSELYETLFHGAPLTPQQRDNARLLLSGQALTQPRSTPSAPLGAPTEEQE